MHPIKYYNLINIIIMISQDSPTLPNPSSQPVISVDSKWVHHQIETPQDLLECPVCFQYIFQPVECKQCQRLFCKYDYSQIKQTINACPLCKVNPWTIKDNIHIFYKVLKQKFKFYCKLCKNNKLYNQVQLKTHLKDTHNKKIKQYKKPLYKYQIVKGDGTKIPLSKYQNIEINYKSLLGKKQTKIINNKLFSLKIKIDSMTYSYKDDLGNSIDGKVERKQTRAGDEINQDEQYIVWTFKNQGDIHQFFSDQHQEQLQKAYKQFKENAYKFETHIDVDAIKTRYRIDFIKMTQINTLTQFERVIQREAIKLQWK